MYHSLVREGGRGGREGREGGRKEETGESQDACKHTHVHTHTHTHTPSLLSIIMEAVLSPRLTAFGSTSNLTKKIKTTNPQEN